MGGRPTLIKPGNPTCISPGNFCWLSDAQTLHAIFPQTRSRRRSEAEHILSEKILAQLLDAPAATFKTGFIGN
jgi:hypothetical protein